MTTKNEILFNEVKRVFVAHGPHHDYDLLLDVMCNLLANVFHAIPPDIRARELARVTRAVQDSLEYMGRTGGRGGVQ